MLLIYLLLICVILYFVYDLVSFCILSFKLFRFLKRLRDLDNDYSIYTKRKEYLESNKLAYEDEFSYSYDGEEFSFTSKGSQKELLSLLYEEIALIDIFIKQIPEECIEEQSKKFYNLRKLIRMEKLFYEKTTF